MRAEDRELEGPELERAQRLEEAEVKQEDDELPVLAGEEVQDLELGHRGRLFDALQLILGGERLTVSQLQLPQREAQALEFLQTAVTGREVHRGSFVFAEDRRAMLEQALAVLQQNLTHGSAAELAALHARFDTLSSQVTELRGQLLDLEDAQDDLIEQRARPAKAEATDDGDDGEEPPPEAEDADEDDTAEPAAPEPEPDDSLTGFIASALHALATVGAETPPARRKAAAPPSSSLSDGPEVPDEPRAATTLTGPDAEPLPRPASTVWDPERG